MRIVFAGAIGTAFLTLTAFAGTAPHTSWGKPGVSFADYRRDSIECGHRAYYQDVSNTYAAQVFKRATSRLETNEADIQVIGDQLGRAITSAHIVESTRKDARFKEVGDFLSGVLERCLRDRGYVQFQINDGQLRRLGKLRRGTEERRAYLYSLASDPRIVDSQRLSGSD